MHPETVLAITAAFAGFLLRTSLAFAVCWALSKIVVPPAGRFLLWFGYLACAGCYWLWLCAGFMPHVAAPVLLSQAQSLTPVGKWQVAASWMSPLSYFLLGAGAAYLLALAYFLSAFVKKRIHLQWVLRFAYEAPEEIELALRPIADRLHVRGVRVMQLSGIDSPGTFGWIRPVILLPQFCSRQNQSELENIFRHELQHVRRRDFIFVSISSFCRALLFFHPAAWYAMRSLRVESELACDLAVVGNSPKRREAYAECLVRLPASMRMEGRSHGIWTLPMHRLLNSRCAYAPC